MPSLRRLAAYAWAAPNTLLGLLAGALMLGLGGRVRVTRGVVEFCGGRLGRSAARLPAPIRFGAMTLGHVIVGIDEAALAACREHEFVHVRQYERWGALFIPAYLASSVWQLVAGRRAYVDNRFEREARGLGTEAGPGLSASATARDRRRGDR